jgi:hypothetical protein
MLFCLWVYDALELWQSGVSRFACVDQFRLDWDIFTHRTEKINMNNISINELFYLLDIIINLFS